MAVRFRKENILPPEGPLSRTLIKQWYAKRIRKGTLMFGLSNGKPGKKGKITFLILTDPEWTEVTLKSGQVVDRFTFTVTAFLDGEANAKLSGLKSMICEPEGFKHHVKGLTFVHVDGTADSDTIE